MFTNIPIVALPRPGRVTLAIQSRLRSLDIEPETVRHILDNRYALALAWDPRNLPNARRNRNLIVDTSSGRKIFKLYRTDWRPQTIDFEHSILKQLEAVGLPAPRPVPAVSGDTWVSGANQRYALFDFIPGRNYSSMFLLRKHRLRLTELSGVILARLHKVLVGFQPQGQHHLGFADYCGPRHRDLLWHQQKVNELKLRSADLALVEDRQEAARLIAESDYLLEDFARLDEYLNSLSLPRVVIHGDYGLHNLVVQSLNQAAPVDFELARIEWRLNDLASCLTKLRYGDGPYDIESMLWFMHGYRMVWPIPQDEWDLFPEVLRHYRLMSTVQYWHSFFETGGPTRKLISAQDALVQANWGINNRRQIRSLNAA